MSERTEGQLLDSCQDMCREILRQRATLRAQRDSLLAALEDLLPVARLFEEQGRRGGGGSRGYVVFNKAVKAIAAAKAQE